MDNALNTFKALSDRNRLRIVAGLTRYEELVACQITELLQVTGATASAHLSKLLASGLIESQKEGRWVTYRLAKSSDNALIFQFLEKTILTSEELEKDFLTLKKLTALGRVEVCRLQRGESCCPK